MAFETPNRLETATYQAVVVDGILDAKSKTNESGNKLTQILNSMNGTLDSIADIGQISEELGAVTATVDQFVSQTAPVRPDINTTYPDSPGLLDVTPDFPTDINLQAIDPNFATPPTKPVIVADFPTTPTTLDANPSFAAAPDPVTYGTVNDLVIDDVPVLTAAEPVIREVTPPTAFSKTAPTGPILPDRDNPDKPAYTLPDKVTLRTLTLPTAPDLLSVEFEGILPTALDAPPNVNFTFTEEDYQSLLSDTLKDKLLSLVLNTAQTGLSAGVEQAIWDRGRERTNSVTQGNITQITRAYLRSGWDEPIGEEREKIFEAMELHAKEDIAESRNITITQADLEQKNFQFAFTQAISLEHEFMVLHNSTQQRIFEAARYVVQSAIDLYQIKATYFNANVTLYTAQSQVYRDRIQAELAKLELYKTQLEGQKLIGELNSQDIQNYRAQIEAVVAIFGLYQSELQAVKTQLEGDSLKLQQFESNIKVFSEEIRAKSLEYEQYKAELSGEETKASIYNSIVNAFGKRIDAFNGVTDARVKKQESEIKLAYDIPLQQLAQETEVFKTKISAEAERVKSINDMNDIFTRLFIAETQREEARVKAETDIYSTDADVFKSVNDGEAQRLNALNDVNKNEVERLKIGNDAEASRIDALTKVNIANTEVYKTQVGAKTAEIEGKTTIYRADADVFGKLVDAEGTRINAQVSVQKQEIDYLVAQSQIKIEALKGNLSAALAKVELVLGAFKTEASVLSQLTAAFGSSINYSAGLSTSQGATFGYSLSHGTSESFTHPEGDTGPVF